MALHVPKNLYTWILSLHVFCFWIKKWSTYQPSQILRRKQTFYFFLMLNYLVHAVTPYFCPGGGGGHSHYGGDADVRLQRPPIFSVAATQWPHFCWLSLLSPNEPHIFCIRLPQEATFCFKIAPTNRSCRLSSVNSTD